jgi:hypothetical protein
MQTPGIIQRLSEPTGSGRRDLISIGGATAALFKRPSFRRFALMLFDKLKREWNQGEDRRQPASKIPVASRL